MLQLTPLKLKSRLALTTNGLPGALVVAILDAVRKFLHTQLDYEPLVVEAFFVVMSRLSEGKLG
jgi:hypothetical protein